MPMSIIPIIFVIGINEIAQWEKVVIVIWLVSVHSSTLIFICIGYSYTDIVSCKHYGRVYSIAL